MKITYFPNQPHCYAFGGFEVQMLAAYDAVKSKGLSVELLDPWSRNSDFDIAHIWGFEISHYNNIVFSKKAGKKIVVTDLLPDFSNLKVRTRFLISSFIYKARILKELSHYVDYFIAISDIERLYISKYFNFPLKQIVVIPNIIADSYFNPQIINVENLGIENFILCVGNICTRKNQLKLIQACNELSLNILLIGNTIEGEEKYAELVAKELSKNPSNKWFKGIKENSNVLKTAYKQCKGFALMSQIENQPISILEALAMNCKVLIADKPYSKQAYYNNALKANPNSVDDIKKGLLSLDKYSMNENLLIQNCEKALVGQLYVDLYNQLITK